MSGKEGPIQFHGSDSDLATPESTHDESVRRDPYKMYLLNPLVDYFRSPQIKNSLDTNEPGVETALKHLEDVMMSVEMGMGKSLGQLEPDEGLQTMIITGLWNRVFIKDRVDIERTNENLISWMRDWIKDVKEGKQPIMAEYATTRKFVRYVTVYKEHYLNFIGVK
jgi:hypothetical protein